MSKRRYPLHRSQLTRPHLTGLFSDAFRPDWEPNLSGWWDASERMSLWDADTAGSLQTVDAGTIGRMEDLSGNGRHLAQSTAGERPALGASGGNLQNGLQTVVFDWAVLDNQAGSKWLSTGAVNASVFTPTGATPATDSHVMFLVHVRLSALVSRYLITDNAQNHRTFNSSGPATTLTYRVTGTAGQTDLSITSVPTDTPLIVCQRRIAGTGTRFSINGGTEQAGANNGTAQSSGALVLPGNQTTFKQKIRLCELLFFTGSMPDLSTINRCGRYLANKWGGTWSNIP